MGGLIYLRECGSTLLEKQKAPVSTIFKAKQMKAVMEPNYGCPGAEEPTLVWGLSNHRKPAHLTQKPGLLCKIDRSSNPHLIDVSPWPGYPVKKSVSSSVK